MITEEQAIRLGNSGFWNHVPAKELARFQLENKRLCMPFSVFHRALEEALGRPVYTHEMGLNWNGLVAECNGETPAPSLDDILNLIPPEKRVMVVIGEANDEPD